MSGMSNNYSRLSSSSTGLWLEAALLERGDEGPGGFGRGGSGRSEGSYGNRNGIDTGCCSSARERGGKVGGGVGVRGNVGVLEWRRTEI